MMTQVYTDLSLPFLPSLFQTPTTQLTPVSQTIVSSGGKPPDPPSGSSQTDSEFLPEQRTRKVLRNGEIHTIKEQRISGTDQWIEVPEEIVPSMFPLFPLPLLPLQRVHSTYIVNQEQTPTCLLWSMTRMIMNTIKKYIQFSSIDYCPTYTSSMIEEFLTNPTELDCSKEAQHEFILFCYIYQFITADTFETFTIQLLTNQTHVSFYHIHLRIVVEYILHVFAYRTVSRSFIPKYIELVEEKSSIKNELQQHIKNNNYITISLQGGLYQFIRDANRNYQTDGNIDHIINLRNIFYGTRRADTGHAIVIRNWETIVYKEEQVDVLVCVNSHGQKDKDIFIPWNMVWTNKKFIACRYIQDVPKVTYQTEITKRRIQLEQFSSDHSDLMKQLSLDQDKLGKKEKRNCKSRCKNNRNNKNKNRRNSRI